MTTESLLAPARAPTHPGTQDEVGPSRRRGFRALPRLQVAGKTIAIAAAGLAGLTLAIVWVAAATVEDGARQSALNHLRTNVALGWELLDNEGTGFSIDGGRLIIGSAPLDGRNDILDKLQQIGGGVALLFVREPSGRFRSVASTTVTGPAGTAPYRAVGIALDAAWESALAEKGRSEQTLLEGTTVIRGPATSPDGEPYLAISRPLVGADGTVVGALFVGVDEAELREVEFRLGEKILIYGIAMAAATVLILFVALRVLLRPLEVLTATTLTIANGEDVTVMPAIGRQDEVGRLARAIQFLGAESSEKRRLQARQEQLQRAAEEQTRIARETMIANIERELDADLPRIASRAEDMARAAHATLEASTLVTNESVAVTGQAQIAAENAAQVGHASDQLTFAIREIAQQINGSTEATGRTVATVNRIAEHTTQLHKAVQSISEVSNLITAIAHQTNLLALNATIEAARAGAVGKGFAVVAGEVKALSRQTTDATKLIHDQLGEIQNATSMLVEGVAEIRVAVDQLNERNFSVASAVEQQEASTAEIGRAIARSREQIDGVSIGMERVAALSSEMVERSSAVEETSREIVGETRELNLATKTILRTDGANRRMQERFRLELPVTLIAAGHRIDGRLIDLSEGGAAVDVGADYDVQLPMKTSVSLVLADSEVAGTLIGKITPDETTLRLRVQFAVSQRALRDGLVKPLGSKVARDA